MNKQWIYSFKRVLRIFIDASLFGASLLIAYKLRLEHNISSTTQSWYWSHQVPIALSVVIAIRISFLFLFQIYSRMWRYTELNEILELTKPIFLSSLVLSIPRIIGMVPAKNILCIPISVIIIDSAISLIFLSSARLIRKWQIANRAIRKRQKTALNKRTRTLLIGAGQAAQELARKVHEHPELDIELICALDDDIRKQNMLMANGIKVTGKIKELSSIVSEHNIEQIIIAIPSLPPKKIRGIIELCQATKLETKIIPGVDQLAGGQVTIEQLRKVSLEDLLGRETVDLAIPEVAEFINNKTVLITGAGGSIGSEIAKQLIKNFSPKAIYLLGRGENSIFQLLLEMQNETKIPLVPIICDIRNYKSLHKHIAKHRPDVVFHAAAHKHVPLMEDHSQEAFENNAIGTKNIAEICGTAKIKTFVNISTDKAVNPVNVLGFTKRLAELIVNSCAKEYPNTKYISVRFGNVIGSRGSVIPIWESQLRKNLPINVTDKNAYRFFMTMSESAQLVIKAGAVGKSSEIMVLDMGNEVGIYQLALDFIRLSGYDAELVKINCIGLRPGEKLKEELVGYYEGTNTTKYKKILVIETQNHHSALIEKEIKNLIENCESLEEVDFKQALSKSTKLLNDSQNKVPVSA